MATVTTTTKKKDQQEKTSSASNDYLKTFRAYQDHMVKYAGILGFITFCVSFGALMPTIGQEPSWLGKVPCALQDTIGPLVRAVSATILALDLFKILPCLGISILALYHLRKENKDRNDNAWQPLPQKPMWFLFAGKIFAPLFIFTVINFKLPTNNFAPYSEIAYKTCHVCTLR